MPPANAHPPRKRQIRLRFMVSLFSVYGLNQPHDISRRVESIDTFTLIARGGTEIRKKAGDGVVFKFQGVKECKIPQVHANSGL